MDRSSPYLDQRILKLVPRTGEPDSGLRLDVDDCEDYKKLFIFTVEGMLVLWGTAFHVSLGNRRPSRRARNCREEEAFVHR